jgi:hypothetical protein
VFYFYFDTRDQGQAKVIYKGFLSSLLLNLGIQLNQAELKNLYQKYSSGTIQMPADAMKSAVLDLLKDQSSPTFILIDAMDECESQDQPLVAAFITDMLQIGSGIKIFVSCRYLPENVGINSATYKIILDEEAVNEDISKHIQESLQKKSVFEGIKDEVGKALLNGAHGQ